MPQSIGSFNGKFSIGTIFSGGASASNTTGTGSGFDFVNGQKTNHLTAYTRSPRQPAGLAPKLPILTPSTAKSENNTLALGIGGSVAVVGGFGATGESADGIILGGDKVALFVCEIG
jgi:hypothetical protein